MLTIRRGDVVIVGIDQGPHLPVKRRPAVVVQNDRNNTRLANAIVAMVTSNTQLAMVESTQVLIDLTTPDGQRTGLKHTSAVKCENLYTKPQQDMHKIGVMSPLVMQQVDAALMASLALS